MKIKLTPSRIRRLRAKPSEYTVWDAATPHLGIRVAPSGTMRYVHFVNRNGIVKRTTIGDAYCMKLDDARAIAADLSARNPDEDEKPPCPTFAEWVDVWWPRYTPHIKPRTRTLRQRELDKHLLPRFGRVPLDAITRTAILAWFEPYSRTSPGAANKALILLKMILNRAVLAEIIGKNPAKKIPLNGGRKLTRFLSVDERHRLLSWLDNLPPRHGYRRLALKLLLFTGCRHKEITTLRWSEVGEKVLNLADSKMGPRTVWLNDEARTILDVLRTLRDASEAPSEYVFPHPQNVGRPLGDIGAFWRRHRGRIGISDVRLHDLRHSFASEAVRQGVPIPIVSKLLGHSKIEMTMRYIHSSNAEVEVAAEQISEYLIRQLSGQLAK